MTAVDAERIKASVVRKILHVDARLFSALRKYLSMKEAIVQMARYNLWANRLIVAALRGMEDQRVDAVVLSSFPSIRKTVAHSAPLKRIWMDRWPWQRLRYGSEKIQTAP
jgi:hypothetical protein